MDYGAGAQYFALVNKGAELEEWAGVEPHQGVALKRSSLFYQFDGCRVPRLVAVTFTYQFNARGVPIIFARPADA